MTANLVSLVIDGREHRGWTEVGISRSIESMTGSFQLSLSRREATAEAVLTLRAGAAVEVRIDGETVITGWLDTFAPQIDGESATIVATGRDRAADLIDCSADIQPGSWQNVPVETIVRALVAPFGITVEFPKPSGAPIRRFALQPGETVQAAIERLLRFRGWIAWSRADGTLVVGSPQGQDTTTKVVRIEEGVNLLSASASHNVAERFSAYIVRGQASGDDEANGRAVAQIKGQAIDPAVKRHRPLVIVAEEQSTADSARLRAEWEANVRAGRAQTADVTVQGWRDADGALWAPDRLVELKSPTLAIDARMLVVGVEFVRAGDGTTATLTLQPPEAWQQLPVPEEAETGAVKRDRSKPKGKS